jgi:hypothetical protein
VRVKELEVLVLDEADRSVLPPFPYPRPNNFSQPRSVANY